MNREILIFEATYSITLFEPNNIPQIDVDEQKQRLLEDKKISFVFLLRVFFAVFRKKEVNSVVVVLWTNFSTIIEILFVKTVVLALLKSANYKLSQVLLYNKFFCLSLSR